MSELIEANDLYEAWQKCPTAAAITKYADGYIAWSNLEDMKQHYREVINGKKEGNN
jgi:hypothetical protein